MKAKLQRIIENAAAAAHQNGDLPSGDIPAFAVELPKVPAHGDFSTNIAMVMASVQRMAPRKIAQVILEHLGAHESLFSAVEIAGPGFINFFVHPHAWHPALGEIHDADDRYGAVDIGRGQRVQVEFVSSNPTGPLHVGHGRGAAVGDSVANILTLCGYDVQREYYINDSGRQIHTLGRSVYLRYQALWGRMEGDFPQECYQGAYIGDLAADLKQARGDALLNLPEDEAVMDCARLAAEGILSGIREDLAAFGVTFDRWFSEQSLYDDGKVASTLDALKERRMVYAKEQAWWFKSTDFGDEKDRVVIRQNGQTTYFASDIAYHQDKYRRGFDRVIDVWGADHHGYIPRVTAAIEALGGRRDQFHVILVQLVNLLRGGQPVAMSTRAGEFVTLADVVTEVGRDAARFIFLTRHYDSPLDFDLELARQKTNDNPVYYVQYVHARIASIRRKGRQMGVGPTAWDPEAVARLEAPEETRLIKTLVAYPETVRRSAELMEPHRITFYLMRLAAEFHAYYNKHRVLTDDAVLTRGRLCLVSAVQKVIRNGLTLLGVSAPERM